MDPLTLALIGGGTGVLSNLISQWGESNARERQAQIMGQALAQATPIVEQGYQQGIGALSPYAQQGAAANAALSALLSGMDQNQYVAQIPGEFTYSMPEYNVEQFLSPGMAYEQQAAQQAIDASAAARGGLRSGATLKELQDRSQAIARTGYDNAFARMMQQQQGARSDRAAAYQQYADRARLMAEQANQRLNALQSKISGLGSLGGQGYSASANIANMMGDRGASLANLIMSGATNKANAVGTGWQGALGGALGGLSQGAMFAAPFMPQTQATAYTANNTSNVQIPAVNTTDYYTMG